MHFRLFAVDIAQVSRFEPDSIRLLIQRDGTDERWVTAFVRGTIEERQEDIIVLQNTLCDMDEFAHLQKLADEFDKDPVSGWERLIGDYHLRTRQRTAANLHARAAWELRGARVIGDREEIIAWEAAVDAIAAAMRGLPLAGDLPILLGETDEPVGTDGLTDWERNILADQAVDLQTPTREQRAAVKAWAAKQHEALAPLSARDAAEVLGMSVSSMLTFVRMGELRTVGGDIHSPRFALADLLDFQQRLKRASEIINAALTGVAYPQACSGYVEFGPVSSEDGDKA